MLSTQVPTQNTSHRKSDCFVRSLLYPQPEPPPVLPGALRTHRLEELPSEWEANSTFRCSATEPRRLKPGWEGRGWRRGREQAEGASHRRRPPCHPWPPGELPASPGAGREWSYLCGEPLLQRGNSTRGGPDPPHPADSVVTARGREMGRGEAAGAQRTLGALPSHSSHPCRSPRLSSLSYFLCPLLSALHVSAHTLDPGLLCLSG